MESGSIAPWRAGYALRNLDTYASVHHLVLIVTGELAGDQEAIALVQACFSGGSELIAEIIVWRERSNCGATAFLGFNETLPFGCAPALNDETLQK